MSYRVLNIEYLRYLFDKAPFSKLRRRFFHFQKANVLKFCKSNLDTCDLLLEKQKNKDSEDMLLKKKQDSNFHKDISKREKNTNIFSNLSPRLAIENGRLENAIDDAMASISNGIKLSADIKRQSSKYDLKEMLWKKVGGPKKWRKLIQEAAEVNDLLEKLY